MSTVEVTVVFEEVIILSCLKPENSAAEMLEA